MTTRRDVTRAATVDEIKSTTRDLMRQGHTIDVTFADIAREMKLTAPALYRYFASRDELLTALITDAYDEIGALLATARAGVPDGDPGRRLIVVCDAYRHWAVEFPERFSLLFGLPLAGYSAPVDGPTTEAARRAMANFKALIYESQELGMLGRPLIDDASRTLCRMIDEHDMTGMPTETAASLLNSWAVLQGFVSLEAYGNLDFVGPAARDDLFVNHLKVMAKVLGLPDPADGWVLAPPKRRRARA